MIRNARFRLAPLVLLLFLAACGGSAPRPQSAPGGPAPSAVVEQFLRLAGEKNYTQMGWLFGTPEGSIFQRDPASDVEKRMYVLATVLQHDRAEVREPAPVPGRSVGAMRMTVHLTNGEREYDVPFIAVQGPDSRWFVEEIDVEAITNTS